MTDLKVQEDDSELVSTNSASVQRRIWPRMTSFGRQLCPGQRFTMRYYDVMRTKVGHRNFSSSLCSILLKRGVTGVRKVHFALTRVAVNHKYRRFFHKYNMKDHSAVLCASHFLLLL